MLLILIVNHWNLDSTVYQKQFPPTHGKYLNDCSTRRIGLDPHTRVKVNITSFYGVLVAKGYNRIVPTWRGFFVELDEGDIRCGNLEWNEQPAEGEESWHTPVLKIFSLTHPDKRRSLRAHRFAIKIPSDFTDQYNPLLPINTTYTLTRPDSLLEIWRNP